MFNRVFKFFLVLVCLIASQAPSFAAKKNSQSYITRYNNVSEKLEKVNANLTEFTQSVEYQTGSYRQVKRLARKIFKRQRKIYKRLKKLSRHKAYAEFTSLVSERARTSFTNFRSNSKLNYRKLKQLKRSSNKLALLEEISELAQTNQELLEELTTMNKSAAFGNPNSSGVFGVLSLVSGNCMPGPGVQTDCKLENISSTIRVRPLTHYSEGDTFVYYSFTEDPIAATSSLEDGSYDLNLEPGEYSIFVLDGDKEYCNSFDADGNACKLIIKEDMKSEYNVTIDHAYW